MFAREYQALEAQYNDVECEMQNLKDEQQARSGRRSALKRSLKVWGNAQKSVLSFDYDLFVALVDRVTVFMDGSITLTFMDGDIKVTKNETASLYGSMTTLVNSPLLLPSSLMSSIPLSLKV